MPIKNAECTSVQRPASSGFDSINEKKKLQFARKRMREAGKRIATEISRKEKIERERIRR